VKVKADGKVLKPNFHRYIGQLRRATICLLQKRVSVVSSFTRWRACEDDDADVLAKRDDKDVPLSS
jgi:hypothetical protein